MLSCPDDDGEDARIVGAPERDARDERSYATIGIRRAKADPAIEVRRATTEPFMTRIFVLRIKVRHD